MSSSSEMTQIKTESMTSSSPPQIDPSVPSRLPREAKPLIDFEDEATSPEDEQAPRVPPKEKENRNRAVIVRSFRPPSTNLPDTSILHKIKGGKDMHDVQEDYDHACREIKILNRENREQSIELRSLKKQNAQLLESDRSRSDHVDDHRDRLHAERKKFYEHVEYLEDQITMCRQESHRRKTLVESMTAQTREANAEKGVIEQQMKKLQKQNRDLSENLTECKDDLLRLQPPSSTPDSEIAEQYSSLTHQISRWVDDETEDTTATEERFEALKKNEDLPESLQPYLSNEHLRLGKKSENAQLYILRYIIHCYLENQILGNDIYLFGLDARDIALFQGIEHGMHAVEPPRGEPTLHCTTFIPDQPKTDHSVDNVTIRRWRSETLLALTAMPEFHTEQANHAAFISQSLCDLLAPLLPTSTDSSRKALHETITLPALKLATALRLSTTDYRIWSRSSPSSAVGKPVTISINAVQKAQLVDVATNKILRPDSVLKVSEDGRIGEEMIIVTPSLLRTEKEKGTSQLLVKPTVLVKLDEPMGKRGRIKGLGDWAGSWFGGASPGGEGSGGAAHV